VAVLALIGWAGPARVVRAQVLAAREIEYVQAAQALEALSLYPWLLVPGALIVLSVPAFNFVGDALRDAFDVRSR